MTKLDKALMLLAALTSLVTLIFACFRFPHWQDGETAQKWLESGIEQLELDYDEINFVKTYSEEENYITYVYELKQHDIIERDSVEDIDIWYCKENIIRFYITFELSNCFWNKLGRMLFLRDQFRRYDVCVDYDVEVIEHERL